MNTAKVNELPKFLAEYTDKKNHALQVVTSQSGRQLFHNGKMKRNILTLN